MESRSPTTGVAAKCEPKTQQRQGLSCTYVYYGPSTGGRFKSFFADAPEPLSKIVAVTAGGQPFRAAPEFAQSTLETRGCAASFLRSCRKSRGRPSPRQGSRVDGQSSPGDQLVELGEEATKWPEFRGRPSRRLVELGEEATKWPEEVRVLTLASESCASNFYSIAFINWDE